LVLFLGFEVFCWFAVLIGPGLHIECGDLHFDGKGDRRVRIK
jgi:hypothetical protein